MITFSHRATGDRQAWGGNLPTASDSKSTTQPSLSLRLVLAMVLAVAAGVFVYWHLTVIEPTRFGFDFTWAWRGARVLLAGGNPYVEIQPTGPFPFNSAFKYPLPVAVIAIPVGTLDVRAATAVFEGAGFGLLTFALTRDGFWRLPILMSAPCIASLVMGQWSLLLTAAALMPAAAWLICVKPTTGIASFVYRPTWSAVVGSVVAYTLCLFLVPQWPVQWVRAMFFDPSTHWYISGFALPFGPLLLLSGLRWRTREGRMLFTLSAVPQVQAFYSGLPALLVARSFVECAVLSLASSVGYLGWVLHDWKVSAAQLTDPAHQAPWLMMSVYLPALILVLLRPNVGPLPRWIEHRLSGTPLWLRGSAEPSRTLRR